MGIDPSFWSGRRVLVTGHSGFKGSWLSLWLAGMGARVTGLSRGRGRLYELARVEELVESIECDVRDAEAVRDAVERAEPEVALHLAAQPIVRRSYEAPAETYAINVTGTVNVLDAVRGVRAVVVVTSDKCYLDRGDSRPHREDDPLGGADPYSSSKACQELVAAAYRRSFGMPLATARAGNVIGGGDFAPDRLVPDVMAAAMDGQRVSVRNPHAVRPWQYVLNPLAGYLMLAQRLASDSPPAQGAFNFGPGDDVRPVGWVVDRLSELWPGGIERADGNDADAPHESHYLAIDSALARSELGWRPAWDLERALEATVEWHAAQRAGDDMREVTLAQIERFRSE